MASASISEWLCEPCKEDGKEIQARTHCHECHELLCEPCSDYHLRLKRSKEHHLIELVQFWKKSTSRPDPSSSKQTSTSINEDELVSDVQEHFTLTENTFLYRRAQVALQSTTSKSKKPQTSKQADHRQEKGTPSNSSKHTISGQSDPRREKATPSNSSKRTTSRHSDPRREKATPSNSSKRTTSRQSDPRRPKATQCLQFSVKRPEDKKNIEVTGVLCVSHNVVVVDFYNKVLKLFDQSGTYLSSTKLKDYTRGITFVGDGTFATCGASKTVDLWSVCGNTVVNEDEYHMDDDAAGIHYNGTYYSVVHRHNNTITVLNRQGRQVREIHMEEACGKKFTFRDSIYTDSDTHNIFVACQKEDGVLCMTVEGRALWFTSLARKPDIAETLMAVKGGYLGFASLSCAPNGITEIQGTLCVGSGVCLHMITKEGEYVRKLLDKEGLGGDPKRIFYGQSDKLYISHTIFDKRRDIIDVFIVT